MDLEFTAPVIHWRGPAPWYFVTVPEEESGALEDVTRAVSYGWGMIPAEVRIGTTSWATSLWPRDGAFVVPLKKWVRDAEGIDLDDVVTVRLSIVL